MNRAIRSESFVRRRLLARIHRSYVTAAQTVRIGEINLEFVRIANPDVVLDQVAEEADRRERLSGRRQSDEHLHLPYWAELWDSALGIGQFLNKHVRLDPHIPSPGTPGEGWVGAFSRGKVEAPTLALPRSTRGGKRSVLDLGCGMGLSGTIAAALGYRVLFADIEPPALLFARLNSLPFADRIRTRRLNWRVDRLNERFDLILGADILYEKLQWEFLEPFWRHHLAQDGAILLGEPGRQTGDLFVNWIATRNWNVELFEERVPTREKPIRIFRLTAPKLPAEGTRSLDRD